VVDEGLERASIDAAVVRIACRLSLSFCQARLLLSDENPSHVTKTLHQQPHTRVDP